MNNHDRHRLIAIRPVPIGSLLRLRLLLKLRLLLLKLKDPDPSFLELTLNQELMYEIILHLAGFFILHHARVCGHLGVSDMVSFDKFIGAWNSMRCSVLRTMTEQ